MKNTLEERTNQIFEQLKSDTSVGRYVDNNLPIPKPFVGSGTIKLIVLAQDPTVKNSKARSHIKTVLNLDKNRSVRAYLAGVCNNLGIKITENVYATNLYKNFFIDPPTQITEVNIFQVFGIYWLPLLKEEIEIYPEVPILTLGQPVLTPLVKHKASVKIRDYWGYTPNWKFGEIGSCTSLQKKDNHLQRTIFPYPHQPSLRHEFYKLRMENYTSFVRATAFS